MEFSEAPKSCFFLGGKMRFNKKAMELMFYDVL